MPKKSPEKKLVQDKIVKKLKYRSDIIWVMRTASYQIGRNRVGEPGHPDITFVLDCGNRKIVLCFLECKRPGVKPVFKNLSYEQKRFFRSKKDKPLTICGIINDPKLLGSFLEEARQL